MLNFPLILMMAMVALSVSLERESLLGTQSFLGHGKWREKHAAIEGAFDFCSIFYE